MGKSLEIQNQLISLKQDNTGRVVIDGRELHDFLEVKEKYTDWFKRMAEYGFTENQDYITTNELSEKTEGSRLVKRKIINHQIILDMTKEICMIQKNSKGKQARQYFIQVEKYWNSPEMVMKRALEFANKQVGELETKVFALEEEKKANAPKVIFADAVSTSKTSILIGELAKILKQNGIETGQRRLFEWLRVNKYLISRKGTDYNMPTQKSMELGLFEIKETSIAHADGHTSISKTPKVTGKGQQYFINKFLDNGISN